MWGKKLKYCFISQMHNSHVGPLALQILDDQAAMAVLGGRFTAQQYAGGRKLLRVEFLFDLTFFHQLQELGFVYAPVPFVFFKGIQDILRGGQQRFMHIIGVAQFAQEEGQVIAFGEGGQLRHIVQPHID